MKVHKLFDYDKRIVLNNHLYLIVFYLLMWLFVRWLVNQEKVAVVLLFDRVIMVDSSLYYMFISMHYKCIQALMIMKACGVEFVWLEYEPEVLRKSPTRDIFAKFIDRCKIEYVGVIDILLPNTRSVLHPVDYFISGLYEIYGKAQRMVAFDTYKRTNPTLPLRLDRVDDFHDSRDLDDRIFGMVSEAKRALFSEVINDSSFMNVIDLMRSVTKGDFDFVEIEGSSAAGYPFDSGVKKRDVREEATVEAMKMLRNDKVFNEYMSRHVWYTTGRAKLQKREKEPSARLICYPGYSSTLLAMLYYQSWQMYMNKFLPWCGVGMSWFSGGARKFAKYFDDDCGHAPSGYKYVTVDIKNWDGFLSRDLLLEALDFHLMVMREADVGSGYMHKFETIFMDMVEAKILFPMGHVFKAKCGMKSGWCGTANDNTLIHELVFRVIQRLCGVNMKHVLYGDDNFILAPDSLNVSNLINAYTRLGLTVGHVLESKLLSEVDFLSKKIIYDSGEYYIFRDSVETDARLLMPEELDPARRDIPDARIAAERIIGHLFDNPFNSDVRNRLYRMLEHLNKHYKFDSIEISPETMKKAPYRFMDPKRIMGEIPIIPKFEFIKELYGVKHTLTNIVWPDVKLRPTVLDFSQTDPNPNRFLAAQEFYESVERNVFMLTKKKRKSVLKFTSPFRSPFRAKGFHGGRLEYALNHWRIVGREVVDFGAHPGAAAYSLAKDPRRFIRCISLVPEFDKDRVMPYIIKQDNVEFIEMNVDDFIPEYKIDLLHDDVDVVGPRDYMTNKNLALAFLKRFRDLNQKVDTALGTVHEMSMDVVEALFDTYCKYGWFDIVKPLWSNPWKPEYMVCFKKSSAPLMRRAHFTKALYCYLNKHSSEIVMWAEVLNANGEYALVGKDILRNPIQDDMEQQRIFNEFLLKT